MSYLLQRNQPLALLPAVFSHNGVLATTVTLGFVSLGHAERIRAPLEQRPLVATRRRRRGDA